MRCVILDLDGTLADTSGDLIAAANACFRALGHGDVLDMQADAGTAFHGGRAMLRLGFQRLGVGGEAEVEREFPRFVAQYSDNIDRYSRLYPGARAAVERLAAAGYRLGVCTNKPEALARDLLARLGVLALFASLVGVDTLPTRKPDPAPYRAAVERAGGQVAQSLLIGDTQTDRDTARAAGVPCIMVTFGPGAGQVAALEPEGVLAHFDGLDAEVTRLIG